MQIFNKSVPQLPFNFVMESKFVFLFKFHARKMGGGGVYMRVYCLSASNSRTDNIHSNAIIL